MPTLIIREGDSTWRTTTTAKITVGRAPASDFILRGETVAWEHALVEVKDERVWITDLKSPGGTFVNGARIEQPTLIEETDSLTIGGHVLEIELRSDESMPTTARMAAAAPSQPPPPNTERMVAAPARPLGDDSDPEGPGALADPASSKSVSDPA